MNFICAKHRLELSENPEKATVLWSRLIMRAKIAFSQGSFDEAVKSCGNALDCAAITFEDNPVSGEVNRYLRTAVELLYISRYSSNDLDTEALLTHTKRVIERTLSPADTSLLLKPLEDVSFLPLHRVNNWMKSLWDADKQLCKNVH